MLYTTEFLKDLVNKKLHITRRFNAPIEKVWKAWTDSTLLDQWWAPKPWKAETKTMDFSVGGFWLYCMAGPKGERSWCQVNYKSITPMQDFTTTGDFSDENGIQNMNMPVMTRFTEFAPDPQGTMVRLTITFTTEAGLEKLIEMGFKEGLTMAFTNLDALIETY